MFYVSTHDSISFSEKIQCNLSLNQVTFITIVSPLKSTGKSPTSFVGACSHYGLLKTAEMNPIPVALDNASLKVAVKHSSTAQCRKLHFQTTLSSATVCSWGTFNAWRLLWEREVSWVWGGGVQTASLCSPLAASLSPHRVPPKSWPWPRGLLSTQCAQGFALPPATCINRRCNK